MGHCRSARKKGSVAASRLGCDRDLIPGLTPGPAFLRRFAAEHVGIIATDWGMWALSRLGHVGIRDWVYPKFGGRSPLCGWGIPVVRRIDANP